MTEPRHATPGRRPPQDEAAERAVLGCCMLEPTCFDAVSGWLGAGDFYADRNGHIWAAITLLRAGGQPADTLLVRGQLERMGKLQAVGGDAYLLGLTDVVPTVEYAEPYARRVRDLSVMRSVIHACHEIAAEGYGPVESSAEYCDRAARVITEAAERSGGAVLARHIGPALQESVAELRARAARGDDLLGHKTGLADLDNSLSGLAPGDLIVLAARPGMGKTALANVIKVGVARSTGKPVFSLELEMSEEQLTHRSLAADAAIPLRRIRSARFEYGDLDALDRSARELATLPVWFCPVRGVRFSEFARECRRLRRKHGALGLLAVDYLQIMRPDRDRDQREREVSQMAADLKSLAGEMECPVLALSQLNRDVEKRADKRPMLSDLRESGAIEQDADTVLFLYRDEVYNPRTQEPGVAELIVAKQRSGPMGTIKLRWDKSITRFDNLEVRRTEDRYSA